MKARTFLFVVSLGLLVACRDPHAGHDHSDHDHDHGDHGHEHAHSHAHDAPHGGTGVELGSHQAHLELLRDAESGLMKLWVMDAHMQNYVRIPAENILIKAKVGEEVKELSFASVANEVTGETIGDSSYFEAMAEWVKTTESFEGEIVSLEIRGMKFDGQTFEFPAKK